MSSVYKPSEGHQCEYRYNERRRCKKRVDRKNIDYFHYTLGEISSTFYTIVFRTKCWRQKLQSCVLGLKLEKSCRKDFHTKNAHVKR